MFIFRLFYSYGWLSEDDDITRAGVLEFGLLFLTVLPMLGARVQTGLLGKEQRRRILLHLKASN
jgi:hypothetical protein